MSKQKLSRRDVLLRSGALGCSLAASPFMTPVTFASAPWENRLVVILLRGGMDGLDVVQPYAAPSFDDMRGALISSENAGQNDLDGYFSLHAGLSGLRSMWDSDDLAFAHAVSTPYRDKRSHFDGQDLLEAGSGEVSGKTGMRDGWLNRLIQLQGAGYSTRTAFAVGREDLAILSGKAPVSEWGPNTKLPLSPQAQRLLEIVYHSDPLFNETITEAIELANLMNPLEAEVAESENLMQEMADTIREESAVGGHKRLAEFTALQLKEETRIASFSLNGWDTHRGQKNGIRAPLNRLQETLITLKKELGPIWGKTAVVAMTEFGRTARLNGSSGTDHGTGGVMVLAGGAVRGRKVYSDWPGLEASQLYRDRDLMPTEDVRSYAGSVLEGLFGVKQSDIETSVFPGLDMSAVPKVIL
ncbi:MAG: DUF1501 domain-containing protein [Pseudoruegeria sp.]